MWSVALECNVRCYSKVRARRKMHRGASAGASCIKTLVFPACSLCSCFLAPPEAAGGTGLSPLKPPAQAPAASAAVGAVPSGAASSGSERKQEPPQRADNAQRQQGSCKVQTPRRHTSKTKLGLYHVSRRVDARPASLPERERLLVLLRPGPLPTPDAGKALIHTQVLAPASLESQSRAG